MVVRLRGFFRCEAINYVCFGFYCCHWPAYFNVKKDFGKNVGYI
jgi:hypothetical protein